MNPEEPSGFPSVAQLTAELRRETYKRIYRQVLRSTVYTLVVVAAFAVLVATIWMPVPRIYGAPMGSVIWSCPVRCRITGTSAWATSGLRRWIPEARR